VTATPSRPVRSYILGIVLAGVLTVLFAIFRARSVGIGPAPEFIAITVLLGLNWSFPLLLPKASGVEALQLDEAFLVTMALLLSPYGTILSFAIGVTAGQIARRRALDKGAFNFGQMVVSVGLAELVIGGLGHFLGDGVTPAGRRALRHWLGEEPAPPTLEIEALVKVFFADAGTLEQLRGTLAHVAQTAESRTAELRAMVDPILAGPYEFEARMPTNALALRFSFAMEDAIVQWARWALAETSTWHSPTDAGGWDWRGALGAAGR